MIDITEAKIGRSMKKRLNKLRPQFDALAIERLESLERPRGSEPQAVQYVRIAQPVDHVEEHRREQESEQRRTDHAAEDGDAQRLAHLGAGALAREHRHDAEYERKAGHDNRPQAELA